MCCNFFLFLLFLAQKTKKEIRKALRHWKRKTCLNFRHKRDGDTDYIRFVYEPG